MHTVTSGRNFFFDVIDVNQDFDVDGFSPIAIIFPFTPTSIMISNESNAKTLFFSFNGIDVDGILFKSETPISFDHGSWSKLHLAKETGGGPIQVRVWAWRR